MASRNVLRRSMKLALASKPPKKASVPAVASKPPKNASVPAVASQMSSKAYVPDYDYASVEEYLRSTGSDPNRKIPRFLHTEKDLESDEAVWDLYKRWCVFFNIRRTPKEMKSRFKYFKENAIFVLEHNKKCDELQLFQYADETDEECNIPPGYRA